MTTAANQERVPWRLQCAVYGVGLFSTSMFYMAAVVVPLWVLLLESSPLLVGMVLGARHVLPLFLSIHGGSLMDRLGGRRVLIFFAVLGIVIPLLYPALPWLGAVLALQMIAGLSDSMGWLGAQTLIGQHMRGSTLYTGRLSFSVRFGHFVAPPAIGAVWDAFGPLWAFMGLSVWGFGMLCCALMLPAQPKADSAPAAPPRPRVTLRDLLPRRGDYFDAFRLLAMPTIALVVMVSMLHHVGSSMQSTFFVVYLGGIGFSGTEIGLLLSAYSVAAALGALIAGRTARWVRPYWLMMGAVLAGVLSLAITPLLGGMVLLMLAAALRGVSNGVSQPMLISTVLRAAGPDIQGRAVGMRGTANRVASIAAPVVMGGLAELAGIEASFYIVGFIVTVLMGLLVLHVVRSPELSASNRIAAAEADDR